MRSLARAPEAAALDSAAVQRNCFTITVPLILIFPFAQRFFTKGIAVTGIGGR